LLILGGFKFKFKCTFKYQKLPHVPSAA
jgi:hypothetical protein